MPSPSHKHGTPRLHNDDDDDDRMLYVYAVLHVLLSKRVDVVPVRLFENNLFYLLYMT